MTPNISDVYKYYDEDVPSTLGQRDPSPPPMSRKDVMSMNKKVSKRVFGFHMQIKSYSPWLRARCVCIEE